MYCCNLTQLRFRRSFTVIHPCIQTHNIGLTWCKSQDDWQPVSTGSYAHQDSTWVERASWLLHMSFWLEANYLFFRTSYFFSLSSSSGLPTLFCHHHLFTSTAANHGSTNTSARGEWNRIEQNDRHFIQYASRWDPTTTQTPLSSPRPCKCSQQINYPWRMFKNSS